MIEDQKLRLFEKKPLWISDGLVYSSRRHSVCRDIKIHINLITFFLCKFYTRKKKREINFWYFFASVKKEEKKFRKYRKGWRLSGENHERHYAWREREKSGREQMYTQGRSLDRSHPHVHQRAVASPTTRMTPFVARARARDQKIPDILPDDGWPRVIAGRAINGVTLCLSLWNRDVSSHYCVYV